MAERGLWAAPDVVPTIVYADLPRARQWLARVFGLVERQEARLNWPGGGMSWFEAGDSLLCISTPDAIWRQAAGPSRGFVMKVYVDDIDAHLARTREAGAEILSEPQDGFWGGRIYRALDLEGCAWEFSQRGRDLSAERWVLPAGVERGPAA